MEACYFYSILNILQSLFSTLPIKKNTTFYAVQFKTITYIIMPAGSEERDTFPKGAATEEVAKNASSKTESTASNHPLHQKEEPKGEKVNFLHHKANPGPVLPAEINAKQEGTKEERMAKAKELNK